LLGGVCSPGSFAGRTGHSGMVKITADVPAPVDGGAVFRQARLPTPSSRSPRLLSLSQLSAPPAAMLLSLQARRGEHLGQREHVELCEWLDAGCPIGNAPCPGQIASIAQHAPHRIAHHGRAVVMQRRGRGCCLAASARRCLGTRRRGFTSTPTAAWTSARSCCSASVSPVGAPLCNHARVCCLRRVRN
jgi:hypothetical protein